MAEFLIFRRAVRDVLSPRRLLLAGPLVLIPCLLAFTWRWLASISPDSDAVAPELVYNTLSSGLIFGFVLVLLAVLFGTGIVSSEVESRTIVYLLTRPIHRARLLLSRFAGAVFGIIVTVWLSTLLLAAASYGELSWGSVGRDMAVLAAGALAYGGLFLLIGTSFRRPLILGLFFAFGWESWAPIMPGSCARLSIMTYLRALTPRPAAPEGDEDFADMLTALNPANITPGHARWMILGIILITVVLALVIFSRREYVPRDENS